MNQREMASKENPLFDQSAPLIYFKDYRPVTSILQKTPQGKYNAEQCHDMQSCFSTIPLSINLLHPMKETFRYVDRQGDIRILLVLRFVQPALTNKVKFTSQSLGRNRKK